MTLNQSENRLDSHYRLLIAVLHLGGDYDFMAKAGELIDATLYSRRAILKELHDELARLEFRFCHVEKPLGQTPEFYKSLHQQLKTTSN